MGAASEATPLRPRPAVRRTGALRVLMRHLAVWRAYIAPSVVGNFGEPILYLVAMGFGLGVLVPHIAGMSYAQFIGPGLVVSTAMYTATFEGTFGSYTRMDSQHTFDAMLATPISVGEIVSGEVLYGGVKSAVGGTAVLLVLVAFHLVGSPWALFLPLLAGLTGMCFLAMGLVVTALSPSYEFFSYYFTLIIAPQFLFSGIFFPIDSAPRWVKYLALTLPLTHVVRLARALVMGRPQGALGASLAYLAATGGLAFLLAARLMRRRLIR